MGLWDTFTAAAESAFDTMVDVATAGPLRRAAADEFHTAEQAVVNSPAGQALANAGAGALDNAKKALAWAPWLVGGALVVAGLFVVTPYVLPYLRR